MAQISAGILVYKWDPGLNVLLVHPGGPYWRNRDEGAWSIPKGLIGEDENKLAAAVREFEEEIGCRPEGAFVELDSITQKGGKVVYGWAVEGDLPEGHRLNSNRFEMEWPPKSGVMQEFPEIDRAIFFDPTTALAKINPAQQPFITRLQARLNHS